MQLAQETMKAINGFIINYEVHGMAMEEMRARLVESENVRWLLYEEARRLAGEVTRLNANLVLLQTRYDELVYHYIVNSGRDEEKLRERVQELEKQKKVDALLHGSAMYSVNLLHKRISKLQHQVSGFKGSVTRKNKVIAKKDKVIAELRRQVSGV